MNAITYEKSKLGFVGVGYMGRPIAQRLREAISPNAPLNFNCNQNRSCGNSPEIVRVQSES